MFVGGGSDAADWIEDPERDLAVLEEARKVGQELCDRVLAGGAFAYVATSVGRFFAMCQGSPQNKDIKARLGGCTSIRSMTYSTALRNMTCKVRDIISCLVSASSAAYRTI
jgi:hypothetical protein